MRIAVAVHDFALGGVERIAVRLAGEWARLGCSVSIISGASEGPLRSLIDPTLEIVCPKRPIARGFTRAALAAFVRQQIGGMAPDVVFLPGNYYFGLARPVRQVVPRAAVVGRISNALRRTGEPLPKAVARLALLRAKARHLSCILLQHEAFRAEAMRYLGGSVMRFIDVGEPVLDELPALASRSAALEEGLVMAAGRLVPQKNFSLAIAAVARLPEPRPRCIIYGEGPQRERLTAEARGAGLAGQIRLAGYVPKLDREFAEASLFLLSSDYEGLVATVIESLAHGVPVVATDCSPTMRHVLSSPELGIVVPPRDPAAMAAAISKMIASPRPDPARLQESVREYLLAPVAARYLDTFERALQ